MMDRSLMTLARVQKHIGALLNEIPKVGGVHGVFVCDNRGKPFAAWSSSTPESSAFDQIGLNVAQIYAALARQMGQVREIEIYYQHRVLVARDLGNIFVVTLCMPNTDRALLRMSLNVAAESLEKDTETQRELARVAPSRADTLSAGYLDAAGQLLIDRLSSPG